jgi:hypothetical protein
MTFEYEIEIDASPDEVWQALRDRDQIRRWHGWHAAELEDEISWIYFDEEIKEEGRTLTLRGGDVFAVTDIGGRTLLRMTRAPKGGNPEWDAYYDDINEGWTTFMQQLRLFAERHHGADRFTLQLSREGDSSRVVDVAGEPGAAYRISSPTGESISGEIWYRTPNQIGLTVSEWGDGLLVACAIPVSSIHPSGASQLVLTGYAEAAFAKASQSWQDWWSSTE